MPTTLLYNPARLSLPADVPFTRNDQSLQARGLVGWWPTVGASRGMLRGYAPNQQLLLLSGSPGFSPDPVVGSMLVLDGTTQFASANSGAIPVFQQTTPFSVACWFSTTDTDAGLVGNMNVGTTAGWFMDCNAGSVRLVLANAGVTAGRAVRTTATNLNGGVLTHAVVTYDGSSSSAGILIYINGVSVALTGLLNTSPGTLVDNVCAIGIRPGLMAGRIADPRIYNRALNVAEVAQLFAPQTRWELYRSGGWRIIVQAPSVSPASGNLTVTANLAPVANQLAIRTATPAVTAALAPTAAQSSAPATATPTVTAQLEPQANGLATATSTLAVSAALTPAATQLASATAAPAVAAALSAAANGLATASATLTVTAALAPAANQAAFATAAPAVTATLAPTANGLAQATATLTTTAHLTASTSGTATAAPTVTAALAPAASGLAQTSASLTITAALVPSASGQAQASAALSVTAQLAPSTSGSTAAAASLAVAAHLAATATATATGSAALAVSAALVAVASGLAQTVASPALVAHLAAVAVALDALLVRAARATPTNRPAASAGPTAQPG